MSAPRVWAGWAAAGGVVFLPLAIALAESFGGRGRWSLEHYAPLLSARVLGLFLRSLGIALGASALATLLGAGAAVLLETRRVPLRPALRLLALSPLLLPPYMQVLAWRPLFAGGLPDSLSRIAAAAFILGAAHAPVAFFFASGGIRAIAGEVLDAARLQAGERAVALRIVLPLAAPAIACGSALTFALSFLDQETPALLQVAAYALEISLQVASGPGAAFALAAPAMLLLVLVVAAADLWARRRGFAVTAAEDPHAAPASPRAGGGTWLGLAGFFALLVGFPLWRIASTAGSPARVIEAFRLHGGPLVEGVPVGLAAGAGAALLAAFVVPRSGRPATPALALAWVPVLVPGAVLGSALIEVYNRPWLDSIYDSPAILAVAGAARFFPIAYHVLAAHLRTVPRDLWDAADLADIPRRARLLSVALPLAAPGLGLAACAVAVLQSGELGASVLVAPPGHRPPAVVISSELHYNVDLEVPAALCLLQVPAVLAAVALLAAAARLAARRGRRRR